jgi:hypothetical protein
MIQPRGTQRLIEQWPLITRPPCPVLERRVSGIGTGWMDQEESGKESFTWFHGR